MNVPSFPCGKRSKLEIYLDILRVVANEISEPATIMYAAKIPDKLLNEMLEKLEGWGLIEKKTARNRLRVLITPKGVRVLSKLDSASTKPATTHPEQKSSSLLPNNHL